MTRAGTTPGRGIGRRGHAFRDRPRRPAGDRLCRLFVTGVTAGVLAAILALLLAVVVSGWEHLDLRFLRGLPSRFAHRAGILPALAGSLWLMGLTLGVAVPIGVGTAIYLEEYAEPGRRSRAVELLIANLAGVPSILLGLFGLWLFVDCLGLGRTLAAGSLTLALLVLPIVVVASREALRALPPDLRAAALAMGATRWQMIRGLLLPAAAPGIVAGVVLALARALGEAAPLLLTGALSYVAFVPRGPGDGYTALPVQIFGWASRPDPAFRELAAAAVVVLLALLLPLQALAARLRPRAGEDGD